MFYLTTSNRFNQNKSKMVKQFFSEVAKLLLAFLQWNARLCSLGKMLNYQKTKRN